MSLLQEIWKFENAWNIQISVLLSLSLQGFLVLSASYKKRAAKKWAVTLADWVPPYALGLISNRQQITTATANLYAFWAPFLFFHLSGSDNILSLSLDENEESTKQWVQLYSQFIAIVFILQRSSRSNDTLLVLPAILVFCAGLLKHAERIEARTFARPNKWKNSPVPTTQQIRRNIGPDYEKLSGAHLAMREAHLPMEVRSLQMPPKKFKASSECDHHLPNEEGHKSLLKFAHFFYKDFKRFMGSTSFSPEQRQFTRHFFLKRSAHDAFKILEMELRIVHDALHTKVVAAQRNIGSILRVISASSFLVACLLFFLHDKRGFLIIDIIITYVLIFGAIVLEILSLLMIHLSDWYLIAYKHYNWAKCIAAAIVNRRRWLESISKFNIICYILHNNPIVNNKLPGAQLFMELLSAFRIIQTTTFDSTPKSPTMIIPMAGYLPQITRDTIAEAKRLLIKRSTRDHEEACKAIFSVDTEYEPAVLKGDASKSVLFDACRLAKQLIEKKEPWKLMSKVWIELLGYAAINCEANVHANS
ncbi:hypothetical protein ACSBR2_017130 [Camellia fascicularis]